MLNTMTLREWEEALELAEANPLTETLPKEAPIGMVWAEQSSDGIHRRWIRVKVIGGNHGSRWAYWAPWQNEFRQAGYGRHPHYHVVVDRLFNGDVPHFAGMLAFSYAGVPEAWVLVSPYIVPDLERPILDTSKERYERSREIYDVETGKTRQL